MGIAPKLSIPRIMVNWYAMCWGGGVLPAICGQNGRRIFMMAGQQFIAIGWWGEL